MKKFFLSLIAIVAISASSVFGSYSSTDIGQLVDANQLKMEFGGMGVLAGSENIRFAVSVNSDGLSDYLSIGGTNSEGNYEPTFNGSVYTGFGYKSPAFGAWLGYEFAYEKATGGDDLKGDNAGWMTHTPHLQFTAMDNNFRINIPFAIGMGITRDGDKTPEPSLADGVTAFSTEVQARYYTQIDYFTAIRLYVRYGQVDYSKAESDVAKKGESISSFGVEGRFYFNIPSDGPVSIDPLIKLAYNTALGDYGTNTMIKASDAYDYTTPASSRADGEVTSDFKSSLHLGLTAKNDVVTVYVEPYVGYQTAFLKDAGSTKNDVFIGNYMELYIYPIESLEVYLELDTAYVSDGVFGLETGSGVRWYF